MEYRPLRIVVPWHHWEAACVELLAGPRLWAWGFVQTNSHPAARELLAPRLRLAEAPPQGADLPRTGEWLVLQAPRRDRSSDESSPATTVRQWELQGLQSLTLAQVGLGEDRGGWRAARFRDGRWEPVAEVKLVGSAERLIRRTTDPVEPGDPAELRRDTERWSRTVGALTTAAWRTSRRTRVLQFGTGRIGSLVAEILVKLGVRAIDLVDPDRLRMENLDATFGMTPEQVGQPKAELLARHLHAMQPNCRIRASVRNAVDPQVIELARGCDLIVTCVNQDAPRLAAAMLANCLLKTHLDIGAPVAREEAGPQEPADQLAADIRLMLPQQACVRLRRRITRFRPSES